MRADSGAASDASRATEPPSDASARGDDRVERPVGALEPKPAVCLGASGLCGAPTARALAALSHAQRCSWALTGAMGGDGVRGGGIPLA